MAFFSYRLDNGGGEARVCGDLLDEGAGCLDIGVRVGRVSDLTLAYDVVADDHGAGARQLQGGFQVGGIAGFIRINEDEVEGWAVFCKQPGEGVDGGAFNELDFRAKAGAVDVRAGDFCVVGIEFKRDQGAIRRQGPREADGAETAERTDLKDAAGALNLGEQSEELPRERGDVDGGEAFALIGGEAFGERGIAAKERGGEELIRGRPCFGIHAE